MCAVALRNIHLKLPCFITWVKTYGGFCEVVYKGPIAHQLALLLYSKRVMRD